MAFRWPFISRSAHDELRSAHETQILRLQRELEKEQERAGRLLEMILDLKIAGAAITRRPTVEGLRLNAKPKSEIQQAIDENPIASSSPRLRTHLASWADKEMELPLKPGETQESRERSVVGRLRTWHLVSEHPDDGDDKGWLADAESHDDDEEVIPVGTAATATANGNGRRR